MSDGAKTDVLCTARLHRSFIFLTLRYRISHTWDTIFSDSCDCKLKLVKRSVTYCSSIEFLISPILTGSLLMLILFFFFFLSFGPILVINTLLTQIELASSGPQGLSLDLSKTWKIFFFSIYFFFFGTLIRNAFGCLDITMATKYFYRFPFHALATPIIGRAVDSGRFGANGDFFLFIFCFYSFFRFCITN